MEIRDYDHDEDLIAATLADGRPRQRIYAVPKTEVVLGRGSKPELELNLDVCEIDGVTISRRRGGGCAVVLDPGNVVVSVAAQVEGIGDNLRHFDRLSTWLIAGLGRLGIDGVYRDGISDLVREDRKVGGACIYRSRGLLFYSVSLLVTPDLALMDRYLAHPPREPDYRRGRTHASFVAPLPAADVSWLAQGLQRELEPGPKLLE